MLLKLVPVLRHFLHRQSHWHGRLSLIRSYMQQKVSVYLCFPVPTNIFFLLYTYLKLVVPHGSVNFDIEGFGPSFYLTPSSFFGRWHLILLALVFSERHFVTGFFRRLLVYLTPCISITMIPHISIQHVSPQYVSVQYVSHQYVSTQYVSIKRYARILLIHIVYIYIHSILIPPIRIHAMRIHSMRIHSNIPLEISGIKWVGTCPA